MRKKLVISLSVVFGILAVILISFWTLFGLSSVTVQFHSTTQNLLVSENEIISAGQFRMHACVLFESKKKAISNIEKNVSKNKKFAYIKILNIETKFPNKYVIHVAEREELFAIKNDETEKFFLCDRELKVLDIVDTFVSKNDNAILLEGLTISNKSASVGDFLKVKEKNITNLHSALLKNNRTFAEQISTYEKIVVSSSVDSVTGKIYYDISLFTFAGEEFCVKNIDFALSEKLQKLFAVEAQLMILDCDAAGNLLDGAGNKIYLSKLDDGSFVTYDEKYENKVALSYDLLSSCKIVVDNLTISTYTPRSSSDIYWSLVEI